MVGCSCCSPGRCLKRRFDALVVDGSAATVPERRSWRRVHEQEEKGSILTGACEYIQKLQNLEVELRCELDMDSCGEEDVSCCEHDNVCPSSRGVDSVAGSEEASSCCSQPTVQVVRTEQGLKMHIQCETRPGLLLEMMELLESSGLAVEEANIECVDQCLVFDAIGISEVETGSELRGDTNDIAASAAAIGARLMSLIGDQTQGERKLILHSTDEE